MTELFSSLMLLIVLVMLQAVLGFDNLLYISLESKRAPEAERSKVRKWGIGLAIGLRIVLLFVLIQLVGLIKDPFVKIHTAWVEADFTIHSIIVLLGGVFIIYTALKEITHMIAVEDFDAQAKGAKSASAKSVMTKIVIMNLVFSFDSILSAMSLAGDVTTRLMIIMSLAIIISGIMMIVLADHVSEFLQKNRMYEVLGLFVLLIVGVMLLSEGGHKAHLAFFGYHVEEMSKATFYFVIITLVLIDIVQGRYQKKILNERG
jgi:predicted tellurium resistance membrane protein TerC